MIDYVNILFGILLIILGLVVAIPSINAKIDGKTSRFGNLGKAIFAGISMFIIGLLFILREIF